MGKNLLIDTDCLNWLQLSKSNKQRAKYTPTALSESEKWTTVRVDRAKVFITEPHTFSSIVFMCFDKAAQISKPLKSWHLSWILLSYCMNDNGNSNSDGSGGSEDKHFHKFSIWVSYIWAKWKSVRFKNHFSIDFSKNIQNMGIFVHTHRSLIDKSDNENQT